MSSPDETAHQTGQIEAELPTQWHLRQEPRVRAEDGSVIVRLSLRPRSISDAPPNDVEIFFPPEYVEPLAQELVKQAKKFR